VISVPDTGDLEPAPGSSHIGSAGATNRACWPGCRPMWGRPMTKTQTC